MTETVFVKTCGLHEANCTRLADEIALWIHRSSVYVQNNPCRIIVCRDDIVTIINEGDVFSLVQKHDSQAYGSPMHDIINHSEKRYTLKVYIGRHHFLIETFVYNKVVDTENIKFRMTDLCNPELSKDFDDYASLNKELNNYLWASVDEVLFHE